MRTRATVLLTATALTVALAGCGGDDGPSKDEFIAQADAVCKTYNAGVTEVQKELAKAAPTAQKQKSLKPFAPALAKAQALATQANSDFQDLTPPKADEDEINTLKKQLDQQAEQFTTLASTAKANDVQAFQKANQQIGTGQQKTRAAMKKYGFKECGTTPPTS